MPSDVIGVGGEPPARLEVRFVLPPQLVDATHALNLSAGVSKPNVFQGRSLS